MYNTILSIPAPDSPTIVEISGKFFENQIILTHRGGESLGINSEIFLTVGGNLKNLFVGDYLDDKSKEDGFWNLGEEFVYPVLYDFDYSIYPDVGIVAFDQNSNSVVFMGEGVRLYPVGDLSVVITVDNRFPAKGEFIIFNVTAFGSVVIQFTTIEIGTRIFGLSNYRIFYILGVGIGLIWNYIMYNRVIWQTHKSKKSKK